MEATDEKVNLESSSDSKENKLCHLTSLMDISVRQKRGLIKTIRAAGCIGALTENLAEITDPF